MPTHKDARLPAHAIAEINEAKGKEKAAQIAWWESWASVGDAKAAERQAFAEVVESQLAFAACRSVLQAKHPGQSLSPSACDCDKHYSPALKAQQARVKAVTEVERSILKHKAS